MDIYKDEMYNIRQVLERLTNIHQEMLGVIKKPENPVVKALHVLVLVAGALTIFNFFELIVRWIGG